MCEIVGEIQVTELYSKLSKSCPITFQFLSCANEIIDSAADSSMLALWNRSFSNLGGHTSLALFIFFLEFINSSKRIPAFHGRYLPATNTYYIKWTHAMRIHENLLIRDSIKSHAISLPYVKRSRLPLLTYVAWNERVASSASYVAMN